MGFLSPVFRPPFKYRTVWQPDTDLPFDYQTSLVFRCLLYCARRVFSLVILPPALICPFVETADMEMAVISVTRLHRQITRRPWTEIKILLGYFFQTFGHFKPGRDLFQPTHHKRNFAFELFNFYITAIFFQNHLCKYFCFVSMKPILYPLPSTHLAQS